MIFKKALSFKLSKKPQLFVYGCVLILVIAAKINTVIKTQNIDEDIVTEAAIEERATEQIKPVTEQIIVAGVISGSEFIDSLGQYYKIAYIDSPIVSGTVGLTGKEYLTELIGNKMISFEELERMPDNTRRGLISVNGINILELLVQHGYAVTKRGLADDTPQIKELKKLERQAIINGSGVWSAIESKTY